MSEDTITMTGAEAAQSVVTQLLEEIQGDIDAGALNEQQLEFSKVALEIGPIICRDSHSLSAPCAIVATICTVMPQILNTINQQVILAMRAQAAEEAQASQLASLTKNQRAN